MDLQETDRANKILTKREKNQITNTSRLVIVIQRACTNQTTSQHKLNTLYHTIGKIGVRRGKYTGLKPHLTI